MSEGQVGSLYDRVINSVIETSSSDFEEHGIPASTLRLFQETWQAKLSERRHAAFPWDPQSADQPLSHAHMNMGAKNTHPSSASYPQPPPPQPISSQGHMPIKQENGVFDTSFLALPSSSYNSNPSYAAQRAANLANMHAAQSGLPGLPRNIAQQQHQPQIKQENNQAFDGAGDNPQDSASFSSGQGMMRAQAEASLQSLEAGGLLRPMDSLKKSKKVQKQQHKKQASSEETSIPGLDGVDDTTADRSGSPVADEDAINSDLDSDTSEDDGGDGEGGAGDSLKGDVIICLYDKVQRVKNKWKCTLKDGVVTIDGKDYVFHKSTGEFEW